MNRSMILSPQVFYCPPIRHRDCQCFAERCSLTASQPSIILPKYLGPSQG
jgi:hypothetical protein